MQPEQRDDGSLVEVRDLTPEEYDATYQTGSGGHELPDHVHAELNSDPYEGMSTDERAASNVGIPNPDYTVEPQRGTDG